MIEKQYTHKGFTYWVLVEPIIEQGTKKTYYIAWVNDEKPGGLLYGQLLKGPDGIAMLFTEPNTALMNAQAVKNSELDSNGGKLK